MWKLSQNTSGSLDTYVGHGSFSAAPHRKASFYWWILDFAAMETGLNLISVHRSAMLDESAQKNVDEGQKDVTTFKKFDRR